MDNNNKKIIRKSGDHFAFYCKGCDEAHSFNSQWQFNNDFDCPTVSPSILVQYVKVPHPIPLDENGKYKIGSDGRIEGCIDMVCHSFIKDGMIQYLNDCTHEFKGQTIALKAW